jgi:opacity protein-like surface antigen
MLNQHRSARALSRSMPALVAMILLAAALAPAAADAADTDPRSRLQRPPGKGPTYITASLGAGKLADGDQVRMGHRVAVVFRPHRAADFLHGLYAANMGLVLQAEKQGGGTAEIASGDLVLRRYLGDMRPVDAGRAVFLGLGAGISHVAWRDQPDSADGSADNFSFLVEAGLEWNFDRTLVLVGKGQYRLYDRGGHNHSGWSLHAGFGLPFPF